MSFVDLIGVWRMPFSYEEVDKLLGSHVLLSLLLESAGRGRPFDVSAENDNLSTL